MSFYSNRSFTATLRSFLDTEDLPFSQILSEEQIQQFCAEEDVHFGLGDNEVYSPAIVLWAWLSQCLSASKCCVAAVARVLVLRVASSLPPCAAGTGAYCKARAKIPEPFVQRLALHVGTEVERQVPDSWLWQHRRVLLADGAECSMPDTPENQEAYPQSGKQKKGLGFPLIRLVVLLAFASACMVGCAMGRHKGKETGETALFRQLLGLILKGDVIVADRYYCTYWMAAQVLDCGADVVFRLHARRHCDFRTGQRLGKGDHLATWTRPVRPKWMDEKTYESIPLTLTIREIRVVVSRPGCRPRSIVVCTSMVNAKVYSKEVIADLYDNRWHVELDIRAIKQTLKMDVLSCKTPEMVRKEIWMHLLAYNLTRKVMAQAAQENKVTPRELSFAGAVQTLETFRWLLMFDEMQGPVALRRIVCVALKAHKVGNRPGRYEPRKVKRRPKPHSRLTRPRAEERSRMEKTRNK
jgi:hypothetical protein